jgi:hypothetical protein
MNGDAVLAKMGGGGHERKRECHSYQLIISALQWFYGHVSDIHAIKRTKWIY